MTQKKRRIRRSIVPDIPCDKIEADFVESMLSVQSSIIPIYTNPAIVSEIVYIQGIFKASVHWLYKLRWNKKHEIPLAEKVTKLSKPAGEHLLSLLNLCAEIHLVGHRRSRNYPNAGAWFLAIATEIKKAQIEAAVKGERKGKDAKTRAMREELAELKKDINPYDFKTEPALWNLVEAALEYKESYEMPNIIDKFWEGRRTNEHKGFLQAYGALIHAQESPEYWDTFVKGEKVFARRGRGSIFIELPLLR